MSWMVEYEKLDDDQKYFVDTKINEKGNVWVKGLAGSGKSIVLIHALREKLVNNPNAKVCIITYTHSLIDMFRTGMNEIGMPNIPIMTYFQFEKQSGIYDYIFCDEVQDFPVNILHLMKHKSQQVYVAGDSNQSIYDNRVEPDKIGSVLDAKPVELTTVYRLTRSIISAVNNLLPNMGIFSSSRDMTKRDVNIRLCKGSDRNEEVEYVWEQASNAVAEGYSATILIPTHHDILDFFNRILIQNDKPEWDLQENHWGKTDYNSLNQHLLNHGLKFEYIGNGHGSFQNAERNRNVILMTYHSSKGMDFENVYLPYLSRQTYISGSNEDTLLMVAMTRSRMNLFITYSGGMHYLVESFESTCTKIELNTLSNTSKEPIFDF